MHESIFGRRHMEWATKFTNLVMDTDMSLQDAARSAVQRSALQCGGFSPSSAQRSLKITSKIPGITGHSVARSAADRTPWGSKNGDVSFWEGRRRRRLRGDH